MSTPIHIKYLCLITSSTILCVSSVTSIYAMKGKNPYLVKLAIETNSQRSSSPSSLTPGYQTPASPAYYAPKNETVNLIKRWEWFLETCALKTHDLTTFSEKKLSNPIFLAKKLKSNLAKELFENPIQLRNSLNNSLLKRALTQIRFIAPLLSKNSTQPTTNFSLLNKIAPQLNQIPDLIAKGSLSTLAITWCSSWNDKKILIIKKDSEQLEHSEVECSAVPTALLWSPNESYLALKTEENVVEILAKKSLSLACLPIKIPGSIEKMLWAPNEKALAIKSNFKNSIAYLTIWDLSAPSCSQLPTKVAQWEVDTDTESISSIRFSPDGSRIAWSTQHGSTTVFNLSDNKVEQVFSHPSYQNGACAWNKTGTKFATYSEIDKVTNIYAVKGWTLLEKRANTQVRNPMEWHPNVFKHKKIKK